MDPMQPPPQPRPDDPTGPRDPFIDALRVVAVLVVVIGHWATTTVEWDAERIRGINALSVIPATRPITWLVQVMPVLFFVGGFSNATLLRRQGGSYLSYLRTRLGRLSPPTGVFFGVWFIAGFALHVIEPASPNVLVRAAEVAALPLWFLGIYIGVIGLAPVMLRLHRFRPLGVLAALAAGAAVVDALRLGLGVPGVGAFNYAFVWLFAHQLGFWYREGRIGGQANALVMAGAGIAGLFVLTLGAGYPVSMVGVPGQARWNTDPPGLPLISLTLWLVGLALAAGPALRTWAARGRLVAALNRRVLSMYLWHVTALSVTVAVLYPLGLPQPAVGSAAWWWLRPIWVAAMAPALVALVTIFARFEIHPGARPVPETRSTRLVAAGFSVFFLGIGVLVLSVTGFASPTVAAGSVLDLTASPLLGLGHLFVGGSFAWAAMAHGNRSVLAGVGAGVIVGSLGVWELVSPGSLHVLGWNPATAILHAVVGALAVFLVGLPFARQRSRRGFHS